MKLLQWLSATTMVATSLSLAVSCGDDARNDEFTSGGQSGNAGAASKGGSTSSGKGGSTSSGKGGSSSGKGGSANVAGDGNAAGGDGNAAGGDGNAAGGDGNAAGGDGNTAGAGGAGDSCGDFVCDATECATGSCPPDCGVICANSCGDGDCDYPETCMTCPADCQTGCGDGCCLIGENCEDCPQDCITVESCNPAACGNNQCNYGMSETCLNCADCDGLCACGDDICSGPETNANCPWDCPP